MENENYQSINLEQYINKIDNAIFGVTVTLEDKIELFSNNEKTMLNFYKQNSNSNKLK